MMKYVFFVAAILSFCSCSLRSGEPVGEPPVVYYRHTVTYPGETLGKISSWYTGHPSNWETISSHNPHIQVRSIQIGQSVLIPQTMVTRGQALPRYYIIRKRAPGAERISPLPSGPRLNTSPIQFGGTPHNMRPALRPISRDAIDWKKAGDYIYPDER